KARDAKAIVEDQAFGGSGRSPEAMACSNRSSVPLSVCVDSRVCRWTVIRTPPRNLVADQQTGRSKSGTLRRGLDAPVKSHLPQYAGAQTRPMIPLLVQNHQPGLSMRRNLHPSERMQPAF